MAVVWYVLIHVSLALIGYQVFTFTNLGAFYAAAAGAVVQGYSILEVHRVAGPRFNAAFIGKPGSDKHKKAVREYCFRLARLFVFRLSIFTMLTLLVAALVRGVQSGT